MKTAFSSAIHLTFFTVLTSACSGDDADTTGDPAAPTAVEPDTACTDTIASIYEPPGDLTAERGAIVRCASDGRLGANELQAKLDAVGYAGEKVTSGARVYRVLYRTERATDPPTPGASSALVYLPDVPRADRVPVVVASHGSRGQAAACAASKLDPVAGIVNDDFERLVLPLAGNGFALIAPDLAGYADYGREGNPPSPYGGAEDTAKSTLDGGRALVALVGSRLLDSEVLVGHSLGGYTALAALAHAEDYGSGPPIDAVVTFAPLWLAQRSWGAIMAIPTLFPFDTSPGPNAISIWYHYSHGELLDGPGHGTDVFADDRKDAVKAFVDETCWGYPEWSRLMALGTTSEDVFTPEFRAAVASAAAGLGACPTEEPAKGTCELWLERYANDRPHLTGSAQATPQVVLWGGADDTIGFDRITCALDRLESDFARVETVCVDPSADHGGIMNSQYDWAIRYIDAKVDGKEDPGGCGADRSAIVDETGLPAMCNMLPPND